MLSMINTASMFGLSGYIVRVETDISRGLPTWNVVGLVDKTIKESAERIKSALRNSTYEWPTQRVTINMAPAGKPKEGSHFDLPIAVGVMAAMGEVPTQEINDYLIFGELSLDGRINPVRGALSLVTIAVNYGLKKIILPKENEAEGALVKECEIYGAETLKEVGEHLRKIKRIHTYNRKKILITKIDQKSFDEIRGQDSAKRAITVCAAGGHGLLMTGSPGCGKTMLAKRISSILPLMTWEETLEVTRIYSIAGLLGKHMPIVTNRPFRTPHQNITMPALLGGGMKPKPGEFSLAHMGVLFMDEFAQFDRNVINSLRQPIEDERVIISRRGGTAIFPGKVIFVAASNPCMCGWADDPIKKCTCTPGQISSYNGKLSGPVLDRIDMRLKVGRVGLEEKEGTITEHKMKVLVEEARKIQRKRFEKENFELNSQIPAGQIDKYCEITKEGKALMKIAYSEIPLSMRTYHRTIKLARTIADLEGEKIIKKEHIAEALQYRREKK